MRDISKNLSNDEITLWRLLFEQSRDGIVVLDQNCKVYEANKKFAEMLGYSMEEVYQLYVWDWDNKFTKEEILEMAGDIDESGHHFETQHRRKDGSIIDVELSNSAIICRGQKLIFCICRDITEQKKIEREMQKLIQELKEILQEIRTLRGIIPICANCKKIRNDKGYWEEVENYISQHTEAIFSHSLCPECKKKLYPDLFKDKD